MSIISTQILDFRHQNKLTQDKLATQLGIKRTTLSAYEQGRAEPPFSLLIEMHRHGVLNLSDLFQSTGDKMALPNQKLKILALTVDNEDRENIEFVPEKAAAGYAGSYSDTEFIKTLPKFRLPFLGAGTYRAFEIAGDSMLPIANGSIVIGQYVENANEIKTNQTYVVVTSYNGIVFKRIENVSKKEITLKSDNPIYKTYSLPVDEIEEIWRTKLFMSYDFSAPDNSMQRIENELSEIKAKLGQLG